MFNSMGAYDRAIDIVKSALEANAIKLSGPHQNAEFDGVESDIKYLNALINGLAGNLTKEKNN